jgi:hypothetical protein
VPEINKKLVKDRLTTVAMALERLESDFKDTTYRQNDLIKDCLKNAREELEHAIEKQTKGEFRRAFDLAGVSWLQIDFARRLLEAEAVEHILGESDYLELSQLSIPWQTKAEELSDLLKQEILDLRDDIGRLRQ